MAKVRFGDVVKEYKGKIDQKNNPYEFYVAGDHMDTDDLTIRRRGRFVTDDVGPAFIREFKKGQILYGSRRTYLRKIAVADFDGVTANTTFVIETKDENKLLQRLIPFIMYTEDFTEWSIKKSKGSTNPYVLFKDLANYEFTIPDLETQRKLADVLWAMNDTMEAYKNLLAATDDMVKARFIEMFGDLETNPKGWRKESLKEHADVLVGYPFPSEGYTDMGIDIVGGYNLMQGYIQWDNSKHWPDERGYEQYLLKSNDIIMAMDRPWVNGGFKIARVDAKFLPALLIQRTACIRGKDLKQEVLYTLLNSPWFAEHCNITGSLVPHISNKDINSFQVIIPPENIQKQFTDFVTQVEKSKSELQKALTELTALYKRILQDNLV